MYKENLVRSVEVYSVKPVVSLKEREIAYASVLQAFETDKYLNLPRISSLLHFHDLCPSWSESSINFMNSKKSIYCFIVLASSKEQTPSALFDKLFRVDLIQRLQGDEFLNQNARVTYLYSDIQSDFGEKLTANSKIKKSDSNFIKNKVVVLKRLDDKYSQFEWLSDINLEGITAVKFIQKIKSALMTYSSGDQPLKYKMRSPIFYEESKRVIEFYIKFFTSILTFSRQEYRGNRIACGCALASSNDYPNR
jgi:hypothetical protein